MSKSRKVVGTLTIESPEEAMRVVELRIGDTLVVGRESDADIPIQDSGISRRHLELNCSASAVLVSDLGSTNGSFLNGEKLGSASELGFEDVIQIGQTTIRLKRAAESSENDINATTLTAEMRTVGIVVVAVHLPALDALGEQLGGTSLFEALTIWKTKVRGLIEEHQGKIENVLESTITAIWSGSQKAVIGHLALEAVSSIAELSSSFRDEKPLQKLPAGESWACRVAVAAGIGMAEIRAGVDSVQSGELNLIGDPTGEALRGVRLQLGKEFSAVANTSFANTLDEASREQRLKQGSSDHDDFFEIAL